MIAPGPDQQDASTTESLRERVGEFFRPGGRLDQSGFASGLPYEHRPQQESMAQSIAEAIENTEHLCIEAGTGVGKSFAYLVPAILAALEQKRKVIVSTYTISLQEQLMYKDIPFIQERLGLDFKAVLVKGRSNYLCRRRLAAAMRMRKDLFRKSQERELDDLHYWAEHSESGSLQDLEQQPSPEVWSQVCAEQGICVSTTRGEHQHCFFTKARRQMMDADLLVVNHHLFFADLAMRQQATGFLPSSDLVVLDEAHQVEDVATEHMGLRLSHYGFEHWLRRLYTPDTNKGLLAVIKKGEAAHICTQLWEAVELLYGDIRRWAELDTHRTQRVVGKPLELATNVPALLSRLGQHLKLLAEEIEDADLQGELRAAYHRALEFQHSLDGYLEQSMEDHVYWVASEGRRNQTVLYSAPVEVGPLLEQALFETVETVVMTSATLAVENDLSYFQARTGAGSALAVQVGSPFDYARQMRVEIADTMPDPTETKAYVEKAAVHIEQSVRRSGGRAFVLFTSGAMLKQVAARLAPDLEEMGLELLAQGTGTPRRLLLERFQESPGAVLLGLDSFWMGVDVPGDALRNVIIARLPFAVPDRPVIEARLDRIRERGGDPFKEYSLPEAVLKFRQGVGRLIRSATDEGRVLILDPRIKRKWYGRAFLRSLPDCPVDMTSGES